MMMQEQGWWFCSLYDNAYKMRLKVKMQENDTLYLMEI